MFEPHGAFLAPDDHDAVIWRYMDLAKFLSLVDGAALYFTRSDLLGDPYEGAVGEVTKRRLTEMAHAIGIDESEFLDGHRSELLFKRKRTYVSCWHLSESESAAMWAIYTPRGYGLAVKSTYERLISSVTDERPFHVGCVRYRNYDTSEMRDDGNWFHPFLHKRHYFKYERELRATLADYEGDGVDAGKALTVDLGRLIEQVYVSPHEPAWYGALIQSLLNRRFGLPRDIVQVSALASDPYAG